jgi:hypothetical protein
MLYGIWCKDKEPHDWLRDSEDPASVIAYESKRAAWSRAAGEYGYHSYTAAKRDGWVEVRPLRG